MDMSRENRKNILKYFYITKLVNRDETIILKRLYESMTRHKNHKQNDADVNTLQADINTASAVTFLHLPVSKCHVTRQSKYDNLLKL